MAASTKDESGPRFVRFFGPVVAALNQLGGSARPSEVRDMVAEILKIPPDVQSESLPSGTPRFDNQVAWARFYLARAGVVDTSQRGVWTLTEKGRAIKTLTDGEALEMFKRVREGFAAETDQAAGAPSSAEQEAPPDGLAVLTGSNHRIDVLGILHNLPSSGFERFCQRLLRESGFEEVTVTGRAGDGGIDGIGILKANVLVSFKVLFQCKRYKDTVGPGQVRDFRGAMMGRADKGIILTTGSFTSDAKREAVRDGVPPIELVDGEKLVDMLETLNLGLIEVKGYRVDEGFFEEFGAPPRGSEPIQETRLPKPRKEV
jgi:restriction system protein